MKTVLLWLLRICQGALIGVGAILPGVSGGVLCVMFGIYRPMMELFSHPFKSIKKYWMLFIPIGIGVAAGFFGLAKLVDFFFKNSPQFMVSLFFGLIAGTLPSLYKDAGKKGRTTASWIGLFAGFIMLTAILIFIQASGKMSITPNSWWFLFCGVVWGLSLVVPGLSSSSILIFLGLYQPMTEGIGNFSLEVILPLFVGIIATALLLARGVNKLFEKRYSLVSHIVLGLAAASAVMIIPVQYASLGEAALCLLFAVIGFAGAFFLDKVGERIKPKED